MVRKLLVHVHTASRRLTIDLAPDKPDLAKQHEELMKRLLAALSRQGHTTDAKPAAGVACFNTAGELLLMKRRDDCTDHPGEWAFPAGGIELGETPEQAARREFREETGKIIVLMTPLGVYQGDGVSFMGFRAIMPTFKPLMCREHTAYVWAPRDDLPEPLHPGVRTILAQRLTKDDAENDPEGQWITLHGAHVFINGKGEITKGPPGLVGQHKDNITGPAPAKKSVKQHVHEILSSGKPFTLEEMHKATGAKYEKQIYNAIVDMNAGKGPVPGLKIEKVGHKTWQIVQSDGTPAPALAKDPIPEPKAPEVAPTPTPEPVVAPEPVSEAPTAPVDMTGYGMPEFVDKVKPVSTPIGKTEADKVYAKQLADGNEFASALVNTYLDEPETYPGGFEAIAKDWKESKAKAMAQWANNVKGGDHKPNPVEVFPEDVALMKALGLAQGKEEYDAAVQKWKEDTAKAKHTPKVVAPPPPAPPVAAPQAQTPPPAPIKPVEHMPNGPTLQVPDKIVPDDHQHIALDDFAPQSHSAAGDYAHGIDKAHTALHKSSLPNASDNKARIQKQLSAKLAQSPHFTRLEAEFQKVYGKDKSLADRLIRQWAMSSGNHHAVSVASQLAIRDAFKMDPAHTETKAFHILDTHQGDETKVYKESAKDLGVDVSTPEKMASFKHGLQDFALAQYHSTQDHLKELGISHMYLVRGMKFGTSQAKAKQVKVKMQPASSFSTAHHTALGFAGGHSLFVAKVPASQIMSTFITGYGCTSESEVVVLNHQDLKMIQLGKSGAGTQSALVNKVRTDLAETGAKPVGPKLPASSTFKPKNLPEAQLGANKGYVKMLKDTAKSGDLAMLQAKHDQIQAVNAKAPKSKAYAKELLEHVKSQHAAWLEEQANKAAKAQAKGTPAGGVKKNAHYYKKLKEQVLNHPMHNDLIYTTLKSEGKSNEQVLESYNNKLKNGA